METGQASPDRWFGGAQGLLDVLAARMEIDSVLADYALGIDERDPDRWLSAFHPDAVFDVDFPPAVLKGHEDILRWARDVWRFQTVSHITSNHRVDLIDSSNGTGIGRGVGIFKLENGDVMVATARLEDTYTKRETSWKIARRKVSLISSFVFPKAVDVILNGVMVLAET